MFSCLRQGKAGQQRRVIGLEADKDVERNLYAKDLHSAPDQEAGVNKGQVNDDGWHISGQRHGRSWADRGGSRGIGWRSRRVGWGSAWRQSRCGCGHWGSGRLNGWSASGCGSVGRSGNHA